jgi:broad specificity phosphatase PhoE
MQRMKTGSLLLIQLFLYANIFLNSCQLGSALLKNSYMKTQTKPTGQHGNTALYPSVNEGDIGDRKKRLVLIRHGRTYMNDLINGIHFGSPGFTDVFPDTQDQNMYQDSPLAATGLKEAKKLNERVGNLVNRKEGSREALSLSEEDASFFEELQLVVTSPLTRALQTLEMGLHEHIKSRGIPSIALPQAAERVYLVSDLGKPRSQLRNVYDFVDFDAGFHHRLRDDEPWHYIPTEDDKEKYVEWRPHGEGQVYACLGEPQHHFDRRMSNLYHWLDARDEDVIALVCHSGVIQWLLNGEKFENCELRVFDIESIKPEALQDIEATESAGAEMEF